MGKEIVVIDKTKKRKHKEMVRTGTVNKVVKG
jgi:hypothetical protein